MNINKKDISELFVKTLVTNEKIDQIYILIERNAIYDYIKII